MNQESEIKPVNNFLKIKFKYKNIDDSNLMGGSEHQESFYNKWNKVLKS